MNYFLRAQVSTGCWNWVRSLSLSSPSEVHRNHRGTSYLGSSAWNQADNMRGSNIWSQVTRADGTQQNAKSVGSGGAEAEKGLIKRMKSKPGPKPRQVAVAAFSLEPKTPGRDKEMGKKKKRATWTRLPVRTNLASSTVQKRNPGEPPKSFSWRLNHCVASSLPGFPLSLVSFFWEVSGALPQKHTRAWVFDSTYATRKSSHSFGFF